MDIYGNFYSDSDLFLGSPLPFSESSFGNIGDFFSEKGNNSCFRRPKKRAGRKKLGVRWRDSGMWVCELREPNKKSRIWLGTYATAEMAARAHDVAAIALRGRSACLNFADSTWWLSLPASLSIKDIQKAAAAAAADAFSRRSVEFDQEVAEEIPPQSAESTLGDEVVGEAFHRQSAEEAAVAAAANAFLVEEEALLGMDGLMFNTPVYNHRDVAMHADVSE